MGGGTGKLLISFIYLPSVGQYRPSEDIIYCWQPGYKISEEKTQASLTEILMRHFILIFFFL